MDIDNLNQESYSNLLQTKEFWNLFDSKKIFLYQEDSVVFKNNIRDFLGYDYIGAPWNIIYQLGSAWRCGGRL